MKTNLTTLYIVRHGQSEHNVGFETKSDTRKSYGELQSQLTIVGVSQAKELARQLKNVHIDAFFSSDLHRARQTAELIALEHKLSVQTTQLMRERVFGKTYDSLSYVKQHELVEQMREELQKLNHTEQMRYQKFSDMETAESVVSRTLTFLRELTVAYSGKTVLVVAHGFLMRALLAHLGCGFMHDLHNGTVKNTGYMKLESDGVDFFVRETHDITLPPIPRISL